MPATRSATRSGKASLVEPAAPHWITSISASDARRLHLIRWGWHLGVCAELGSSGDNFRPHLQ